MEKLKLLWSLMRSKTYVVLTDTRAVVMIPLVDLKKFDSVLLLSAQTSALYSFREKLEALISEHEETVEMLTQQSKTFSKRKVGTRNGKK